MDFQCLKCSQPSFHITPVKQYLISLDIYIKQVSVTSTFKIYEKYILLSGINQFLTEEVAEYFYEFLLLNINYNIIIL